MECTSCCEYKDLICFEKLKKSIMKICVECKNNIKKPEKCIKCNVLFDEENFKFRTDLKKGGWRNICNKCINSKKYWETYRTKKREENEEEYLKHNAETHKKWADDNPDKIKEQQLKGRIIPYRKLCQIRQGAKKRDIEFREEDFEKMENKLTECCHYCGYKHDEYLNGLDRVDNIFGYFDKNTVSCCTTCNMMKCDSDINVYIKHIRKIYIFNNNIIKNEEDLIKQLSSMHLKKHDSTYKKPEKNVLLSSKEKNNIMNMNCYLCDDVPPNGIDRYDSSLDYTIENSKPCCKICNYMKKDYIYSEFLNHVGNIHQYTKFWVLTE